MRLICQHHDVAAVAEQIRRLELVDQCEDLPVIPR